MNRDMLEGRCKNCGAILTTTICDYCRLPMRTSSIQGRVDELFGTVTLHGEDIEVYVGDVQYNTLYANAR